MQTANDMSRAEWDAWLNAQFELCRPLDPLVPRPRVVARRLWDAELDAACEVIWALVKGLWGPTVSGVKAFVTHPAVIVLAVIVGLFLAGFVLAGAQL